MLVATLPAAPAFARPTDIPDVPQSCRSAYRTAVQWDADTSRVADRRIVVFDGRTVRLTPRGWSAYNPTNASWTLWFHSLAWTVPLALQDPVTAVDVVLERDVALPDPGQGSAKNVRQRTGWTQGMFRNRLEVVTCLWQLTKDDRLRPVAERLAAANMDPKRYPGLPYFPPHNHGTMSNIALIQAGKRFDEQSWVDYAMGRLATDMPHVFDECGMMFEQSSTYQRHNVRLWSKAAAMIGMDFAAPIRALGALVRPDGVLEAIGSGNPVTGMSPNGENLWCPNVGWAAGMVSDAHYIVRFGPQMDYHGHRDHGAVTWYAAGVPVLSDRGLYDKSAGPRRDFAEGMAAHSVLEPVGIPTYNPESRAIRRSGPRFIIRDSDAGVTRVRDVRIAAKRLTVRDRATGASSYIQHWQLAPGWQPTATGAVHAGGATLRVDCPNLRAVRVESFPGWRKAERAWDLQCRFDGSTLDATTVLTVRAGAR